ncbi:sarcosine oxidase [Fusarium langsethiae]|uniref:Sarcosine oxidase n=1 Tax=Fusarium langsethiae TaxID=179993 RepID=A0A0N0DDH0_FUSLA|nr:sarcosine oxidase [Fusarium langsethiae]GKU08081.1 unnamed protein product [Fusarium langsethiae]GKU23095.1 unnamed protein product [Fusarium langsethiae]
MADTKIYDVVVVGGGPVGLAAGYEVAKSGASVMILEQNNFFNQAGSSGDLARMFRTMYTEEFMAELATKAMKHWDTLEKDAGVSLRWMGGLLNFGDKDMGGDTPEGTISRFVWIPCANGRMAGTLLGPIDNLKKFDMHYKELSAEEIEDQYPFKDLKKDWMGLFAPDNGVINVQLLLRTLYSLARDYGADAKQHTEVNQIRPSGKDKAIWEVHGTVHGKSVTYLTKKIVITSGSYVNHVLKPSFGISLGLEIWEMVATYFNTNAGPNGTIFPIRIAVDAATRTIKDPSERQTHVLNPEDIKDTQDFVRDHVVGVDPTVPASTVSCLQTNVFDNMFVLDFLPKKYLNGGAEKSVAIFTAGWAMKFVPTLGKALSEMVLKGDSDYKLKEFSITPPAPAGKEIIQENCLSAGEVKMAAMSFQSSGCEQAQGSSCGKRELVQAA